MTAIDFFIHRAGFDAVETSLDLFEEQRLVVLHGDHVVSLLPADLGHDVFFAANCVDGDDAPFQGQKHHKDRDCGDFVGLRLSFVLTQNDTVRPGPGTHQVDCDLSRKPVVGMAKGLAVDGNDLASHDVRKLGVPALKSLLQIAGVHCSKHPAEYAVWRYAVCKRPKFPQLAELFVSKILDLGPGVPPRNHCGNRQENDA